jgi:pullulanase/glycogen debranching enzyme
MKKQGIIWTFSLPLIAGLLVGCGETSSSAKSGTGNSSSGAVTSVSGGSGVSSGAAETSYADSTWEGKVKIYYHNDQNDYATKRLWVWAAGVGGSDLGEVEFDNQTSADDFGVYKVFDLSDSTWAGKTTTSMSFIVKTKGTWSGQSTDTLVQFGKYVSAAVDNMITVYACDGEGGNIDTYVQKNDALGDRIATAAFTSWTKIHVTGGGTAGTREASEVGKVESYRLYGYDASYYRLSAADRLLHKESYFLSEESPKSNAFDITLAAEADPSLAYTIEAYMSLDTSKKKSKSAAFTALFDTANFTSKYTYTGTDLGCSATHDSAIFKVWAPTSYRMQVTIFMTGTPADIYTGKYDPTRGWGTTYEMEKGEHGVWQLEIKDDLLDNASPYFYTYTATNAMGTNEVCDPYAKATGINGRRAAIVDFKTLSNPTDWDKIDNSFAYGSGSLLPKITSANQLSVYEAHIRDLTADKTWVSNNSYKNGTYQAFSEAGTTYSSGATTVKTGRDDIAEMKFNAVQLLPVFDQDNDERWTLENGDPVEAYNVTQGVNAPAYNWGYNPLNYNVVEGVYSSNPFDPLTRVSEYKQLIKNYADDGIRIIMDVVYNHVSSVNNCNFTKLVPYYYFRTNAEGYYTNGSGVGNETATERPMMSQFIVQSLCWWAKEYKIKGFRFDVMGVLDVATMKAASKALYAIDPTIVLYGEGWTADGSHNMDEKGSRATAAACYSELYANGATGDCPIAVGCFNSVGKSALKGEEHLGWGFMNKGSDWGANEKNGVCYMLNGHMGDPNGTDFGANPTQTVNYASCHDNYTQYDQMNYTVGTGPSSSADSTVAMEATVASCAAVLFSEGIAFTQGGEEIFRQKVMKSDDPSFSTIDSGDFVALGDGTKLVRNSYMYGDAVNSYKWDRKVTYNAYFEKFKAAGAARASVLEAILGRGYDSACDPSKYRYGAQGVTGWSDAIDHGAGLAYQMLDNSSHYYYGFLLGRIKSDGYGATGGSASIGMGSGTYQIVYDSYGRSGSITVGTSYTFTGYQNEFLVLKNF